MLVTCSMVIGLGRWGSVGCNMFVLVSGKEEFDKSELKNIHGMYLNTYKHSFVSRKNISNTGSASCYS